MLHELLGRLASSRGLLELIWSEELVQETTRVLIQEKGLDREGAEVWIGFMTDAFPAGCVDISQIPSDLDLSSLTSDDILAPNSMPTLVALPESDEIESIGRGGEALSSFVIVSEPIPLTVAPAGTHPAPVLTLEPPPLTITDASFSNESFRVAKAATAISAKKAPLGTSIRFTLSAAAKLQVAITSSATGLRHASKCVAPSARLKKAHLKHCTRTVTDGTLTRSKEAAGTDHIEFSGRIGRRSLKPGAYHAILSASDAAATASTVTLAFTIEPAS